MKRLTLTNIIVCYTLDIYLQLCSALTDLGCKQSKYDPAVYLYYGTNGVLDGLVLTHVDDLMHGSGGKAFQRNVMGPLKKRFQFGSENRLEFRYVGISTQSDENITLTDMYGLKINNFAPM